MNKPTKALPQFTPEEKERAQEETHDSPGTFTGQKPGRAPCQT